MDLFNMMGKFKEMQQKMEQMKREMENMVIDKQSVNGEVKVSISGDKKVLSIEMNPNNYGTMNKAKMEELIVKTLATAFTDADILAQQKLKAIGGDMLPGGMF